MPQIIGIRFRPVTKIYYFDPGSLNDLDVENRVIVETSRGLELGMVAQGIRDVPHSEIKGKLKQIIRKATAVDLLQAEQYRSQEASSIEICNNVAKKANVPIKVLAADYSFDGSRLIFSFAAEQRVDFRDLVKELTRMLQTRIEMKQVGARDETKIIDGYGRCGRRLCCSSWLTEFHPVSIRMAKSQGLPLAPAEISGLCGRLLCCLAYENDQYEEIRKTLPRVNTQVKTANGAVGIVRGLNIIKETVLLELEEQDTYTEISASEVEVLPADYKKRKPLKKDDEAKTDAEPEE